jgi:CSLREA domain-containing protein
MKIHACNTKHKTALASLVAAMLIAGTVQAATINVSTFNDVIANDGACSLREAVIAANTNSPSGDAAGECAAGQAAPAVDVINLLAGTYLLEIAPEDATPFEVDANTWQVGEYTATWMTSTYVVSVVPDATKGDLDVTESVSIVGAGKDLTIVDGGWAAEPWDVMAAGFDPKVDPVETSAGFGDRVFHVVSGPLAPNEAVTINVQMSGLTVRGGKIATVGGMLAPNQTTYSLRRNGGGVATGAAAGTYDPAASSGGVPGGGGKGGAPIVEPGGEEGGATYMLALSDITIMSNYAGDGGGLYSAATATASNLTVSGNRGNANGGGIYNDAPMTLTNSTVSGNSSEGGGALFDTGSHLTSITGSTVNANGAVGGGGISSRSGVTIIMVNSTVSGNYGFDVGGGVYTNGQVQLIDVTIANNVSNADSPGAGAGINTFPSGAANVTLRNTLLANNFAGADPLTRVSANCGATGGVVKITSVGVNLGYNLSSDNTCLLWGTGDLQNVDAKILALADNGGPTMTHALDATSPAINAAAAVTQLTADQRGIARDSVPDIGAYEYVVSTSLTTDSGGGDSNGGCLFTASSGGGGPVDPTLPALVITAAMFLAMSRAGHLRRRPVLVR